MEGRCYVYRQGYVPGDLLHEVERGAGSALRRQQRRRHNAVSVPGERVRRRFRPGGGSVCQRPGPDGAGGKPHRPSKRDRAVRRGDAGRCGSGLRERRRHRDHPFTGLRRDPADIGRPLSPAGGAGHRGGPRSGRGGSAQSRGHRRRRIEGRGGFAGPGGRRILLLRRL